MQKDNDRSEARDEKYESYIHIYRIYFDIALNVWKIRDEKRMKTEEFNLRYISHKSVIPNKKTTVRKEKILRSLPKWCPWNNQKRKFAWNLNFCYVTTILFSIFTQKKNNKVLWISRSDWKIYISSALSLVLNKSWMFSNHFTK